MRFVLLLLLLLLAGWPAPARCEDSGVALVCDVRGPVRVVEPGRPERPARILDTLQAGTRLRLGPATRARLTFLKAGLRVDLTGPCEARVGPEGVEAGPGVSVRPGARASVLLPAGVNLDRLAGVVRTGPDEPQWTTDPVVASTHPRLTWVAPASCRFVKVSLSDREARQVVFSAETEGDILEVPEGKLQPGRQYRVDFWAGPGPTALQEQPGRLLEVLGTEEASRLQEAESKARADFQRAPDDPGALVEALSVCLNRGLYGPALELAEKVAGARSEDAGVRAVRVRLLHFKGRHQEAKQLE